jgi:hypothetical protein|tara:strand:- start:29 stop:478 length:450 start_codon:yes stop_codon:yes gene_type:complete
MKKHPFKMKGYSYPGNSPLKGAKRRRAEAIAANRAMAEGKMDEAFSGELDKATDLMASEGFIVNAPKQPTTNVLAKGSAAPKKSPAKGTWDAVAKGFTEAMKSEEVQTAAITSAIDAGAQLGAHALTPKKKTRQPGDFSGFSRLQFGRK